MVALIWKHERALNSCWTVEIMRKSEIFNNGYFFGLDSCYHVLCARCCEQSEHKTQENEIFIEASIYFIMNDWFYIVNGVRIE